MSPEYAAILEFSRKLEKLMATLWGGSQDLAGLPPGERPPETRRLNPALGKSLQTELSMRRAALCQTSAINDHGRRLIKLAT